MAAEWRRLGETTPNDLCHVFLNTHGLLYAVATTRDKLRPWAAVSVTEELELALRDIGDSPVALLGRKHPSLPSADLDRAAGELARIAAQHARAGDAFFLYCRSVGRTGRNDAQWVGWNTLHSYARFCGAAAMKRVRAAAAQTRAFEDAVRSARSFPPMSPGWTGWMAAADSLAACAVVSCSMALQFLRQMMIAVEKELQLLNALPAHAGGQRPLPSTQ